MRRRPFAALAALGVPCLLYAGGCATPCQLDSECPPDQHCGEQQICEKECDGLADCDISEFCYRGRCSLDARPQLRWLEPAEGAEVGERFDARVEVRYRAAEVTVALERDPTNEGEPCAPLVPERVILEGDLRDDSVQVVTFEGVRSLGATFGLQAVARAPGTAATTVRRSFRGAASEALGGLTVHTPTEGFVDADEHVTLPLEASLENEARVVSAWLEPANGARTPRRVLAQQTREVVGHVPLARGAQILWLEAELPGGTRRCGVGLRTEPTSNPDGVEIGLAFDGAEPSNLDLWIYADLDDGEEQRCSLEPPSGVCAQAFTQLGLREHGEEVVVLPPAEGIYGVAVAPAAATANVSSLVRISNRNVHLGFFGPRSVLADQAEVWLAGRVLLLGGTVTLEPLDEVSLGLPAEPASSW